MHYIPVIGLEIHAALSTKTKAFCSCKNQFGAPENTNVCPICLGHPGTYPQLNQKAVQLSIQAGLAFGCQIAAHTSWDRKNYFYPDCPKGYQISQLHSPICTGGGMEIQGRYIRIDNIHLEEDTGKLIHADEHTTIDFNRCGVPLIEIVTQPDLCSAQEAVLFAKHLRLALQYAGICDGKMECGNFRMDANISLRADDSTTLGTRVEIKNLNSFKALAQAIDAEITRQTALLSKHQAVEMETRRFLPTTNSTVFLRKKEQTSDYRYFPDPQLCTLKISAEEIAQIQKDLPEMPLQRAKRYENLCCLSHDAIQTLIEKKFVSDFFDAVIALGAPPKLASNLILGEVLRYCNEHSIYEIPITPHEFCTLLTMISDGKLTNSNGKYVLSFMLQEKGSVNEIIKTHHLACDEDLSQIQVSIQDVLSQYPTQLEDYYNGKEKLLTFFLGECIRKLRGRAHPKIIQQQLQLQLQSHKK